MWQAIFGIIDKILAYFSPKQNMIRLKKELRDLENERTFLLMHECNAQRAKRIIVINERIKVIHAALKDHVTD